MAQMYVEMLDKKTGKWSIVLNNTSIPVESAKEKAKEWMNTIQDQFKCQCDGGESITFFQNQDYAFKVHEVSD